ncbi:MAG: phosphoenolpyruvate--protein phosphotransferase [Chitinivibrionales bacterium]
MNKTPRFVRGKSASDGIVMGAAVFLPGTDETPTMRPANVNTTLTLEDFLRAVAQTREQLVRFQRSIQERMTETVSQIFAAHLAILDDAGFTGRIRTKIENGTPVVEAVNLVVNDYESILSQSPNPRLREKVQDLTDLTNRILSNLTRSEGSDISADYHGKILITSSLLPSDILRLVAQKTEGVILTVGGITAHISVLAQSLGIPMVLVDASALGDIAPGTPLLMDAYVGTICVDPDSAVLTGYKTLLETRGQVLPVERDVLPETRTKDGRRIRLLAAIGLVSEAKIARELRAEGIGLYRSEMPFLLRDGFPSEDEQYAIYRSIMKIADGREIIFRTLDIGGDKILRYCPVGAESNPFLGLRGLRFSFRHQEIFKTQVRALLRAGFDRPVKIMFPLVASVDGFLFVKAAVQLLAEDLKSRAIPHQSAPEIGAMIELPCAVGIADELAAQTDFFSIGTNDLVQYMLAIDRTNEQMADWYVPWHPGILRAISALVQAARKHDKNVSLCGDMASAGELIPVLIGMGISAFTVPPRNIPRVQKLIMGVDSAEAEKLSRKVLDSPTVADAARLIGLKWKPAWKS